MSDTASPGSIRAGGAFVEFETVDGKFNKSMTMVQNRLKAFGSFATKAGAALSAASASVIGGMLAAAKATADAGGALVDMSDRTGIAIKFLSEMRYGLTLTGSSLESFETAVRAMSKNLYSADEEGKAAVQTLTNLGLSVSSLKGLAPEEAFLSIADALAKVEDPTRRSALAMKVFGRAGAELLPLLQQGRSGILGLNLAGEKAGVTMRDVDAQAADALGDSLDALQMSFAGVTTQVGLAVAGPLTEFATSIKDQIPHAAKWIKENHAAVVTIGKLAAGAAVAGSALTAFGIACTGASLGLAKVAAGFKLVAASAVTMTGLGLAAVAFGIAKAFMHWSGTTEELNRQLARSVELNEALSKMNAAKTQGAIDGTKGMSLEDQKRALEAEKAVREQSRQFNVSGLEEEKGRLSKASGFWNTVRGMTFGSGEVDTIRGEISESEDRIKNLDAEIAKLDAALKDVDRQQAERKAVEVQRQRETAFAPVQGAMRSASKWSGRMYSGAVAIQESARQQVEDATEKAAQRKQADADDAASIKEDQKSPEEKARDRLKRLQSLKDKGLLTDQEFGMERAKIQLESTQTQADKLAGRVEKRESLNVGVSEEQKNFLAMQAGRMSLEEQSLKKLGDSVRTEAEILAEQRKLNAYLTSNGVSVVEIDV